jgi:hypothetical protein
MTYVLSTAPSHAARIALFGDEAAFLPYIEEILEGLRVDGTDSLLFSGGVFNLYTVAINRIDVGSLDAIVRSYESKQAARTMDANARSDAAAFVDEIYGCNAYLRVKVFQRGQILEFQLVITDSLPPRTQNSFPYLITSSSRFEGFIVDISRSDIKEQLSHELRRLFPRANRTPVPMATLDCEPDSTGCYLVAPRSVLNIDATASIDADDSREFLRCVWQSKRIDSDGPPCTIDPAASYQQLFIPDSGMYEISLQVSDGITASTWTHFVLKVTRPPEFVSEEHVTVHTVTAFRASRIRVPVRIHNPSGTPLSVRVVRLDVEPKFTFSDSYRIRASDVVSRVIGPTELRDTLLYTLEIVPRVGVYRRIDGNYLVRFVAANSDKAVDTFDLHIDFSDINASVLPAITSLKHRIRLKDGYVNSSLWVFRPTVAVYLSTRLSLVAGPFLALSRTSGEFRDHFDLPDFSFGLRYDRGRGNRFPVATLDIPVYVYGRRLAPGLGFTVPLGAFRLQFEGIPNIPAHASPEELGAESPNPDAISFSIASEFKVPLNSLEVFAFGWVGLLVYSFIN